ncbi:hypothetical protein SAMN05216597_4369 [Pseudomonas cannabina]|nr:hypothetical protein SAMN05216597_4369 [Pseudomonas cannabina]
MCLRLCTDQVEVVAGLQVDVAPGLQGGDGGRLLTLVTAGDAVAAADAELEAAAGAAVDASPALTLAGFLAVAASGGIEGDVLACDVDVAAGLKLATGDLHGVVRRQVHVVASAEGRGAVGFFDDLLAGALLAIAQLGVSRGA